MNTQAEAINGIPAGSSRSDSSVLSALRPFYWSVRRELWENRAVYIAPFAAAAVFLLGFLFKSAFLPGQSHAAMPMDGHSHDRAA